MFVKVIACQIKNFIELIGVSVVRTVDGDAAELYFFCESGKR